jgi:Transposase
MTKSRRVGRDGSLNATQRARAVALYNIHRNFTAVARMMHCSQTFVRDAVRLAETHSHFDRRRSGRPTIVTPKVKRLILRKVHNRRGTSVRSTTAALRQKRIHVSKTTVWNVLKRAHLRYYTACPKPRLTATHKTQRLAYATNAMNENDETLRSRVFIDEKCFSVGGNGQGLWLHPWEPRPLRETGNARTAFFPAPSTHALTPHPHFTVRVIAGRMRSSSFWCVGVCSGFSGVFHAFFVAVCCLVREIPAHSEGFGGYRLRRYCIPSYLQTEGEIRCQSLREHCPPRSLPRPASGTGGQPRALGSGLCEKCFFVSPISAPFFTPRVVYVRIDWSLAQDGAPQHTAELVSDVFERAGVPRDGTFPARSPDLNLIENVWAEMAKGMLGHAVWTEAGLVAAIRQEWAKITPNYVQRLYGSWWDRLQAVVNANGGATRY